MQKQKIRYRMLVILAAALMILAFPSVSRAAVHSGKTGSIAGAGSEKAVILEYPGGRIKKRASSDGTVVLPAEKNGKGYTFLGWSTRRGQSTDPEYQAYEKIRVNGILRLYPVRYQWNKEENLAVGNLARGLTNYSRVIFVGDSRMVRMNMTLERQYGSAVYDKVGFVCKSGKGLEWFREEGMDLLLKELNKKVSDPSKPVAVIFNLGVNDLAHRKLKGTDCRHVAMEYASYMNRISKQLSVMNCKLFYMAVNPMNTAMRHGRREGEVRGFNVWLRRELNGRFTWLNTYAYLMKNGYSTYNELSGRKDDGLHYSMRTYKRIYAYVMGELQKK